MNSMFKVTSTFFFGLALAFGAIGFVAVQAEAQVGPDDSQAISTCPTGTTPAGLPTCPPGPCGFLGLFTCAWHNVYVNGVYVGLICGC